MDELLRYASLAGAGLPAHERHKAKAGTVRRLKRAQFDSDGSLRFTVTLACNERDPHAAPATLTFSATANRDGAAAMQGATQRATNAETSPAPVRGTRKLTLLIY